MNKLVYLVGIPNKEQTWRRIIQGSDIDSENVIRAYWLLRFENEKGVDVQPDLWNDGSAKIIDLCLYGNEPGHFEPYKLLLYSENNS